MVTMMEKTTMMMMGKDDDDDGVSQRGRRDGTRLDTPALEQPIVEAEERVLPFPA